MRGLLGDDDTRVVGRGSHASADLRSAAGRALSRPGWPWRYHRVAGQGGSGALRSMRGRSAGSAAGTGVPPGRKSLLTSMAERGRVVW